MNNNIILSIVLILLIAVLFVYLVEKLAIPIIVCGILLIGYIFIKEIIIPYVIPIFVSLGNFINSIPLFIIEKFTGITITLPWFLAYIIMIPLLFFVMIPNINSYYRGT